MFVMSAVTEFDNDRYSNWWNKPKLNIIIMNTYDCIVIGSGQAGTPLAKKLAAAGKKTLLIERRFVGGTCVNDGCTPTKTMVASARMAYLAAKSNEMGVTITDYKVDMRQVKKRKDDIVLKSRNGGQAAIEKTPNLDLVFGDATFIDTKTILVKSNNSDITLEFKSEQIFINTGAKTIIPMISKVRPILTT
jgi:pyruvate/2-oxoglutarate dehydrogenase complex dihydrolipoamide dehydrogenase (E3) component